MTSRLQAPHELTFPFSPSHSPHLPPLPLFCLLAVFPSDMAREQGPFPSSSASILSFPYTATSMQAPFPSYPASFLYVPLRQHEQAAPGPASPPRPPPMWPSPTPRFRSTVESVRSLCHLLMGSLLLRCSNTALAMPRLPSEFSKSIGFTLWGMVELPTSPAIVRCLQSRG
jgi:hypothetical protein